MELQGSMTVLLERVKGGDQDEAVRLLWEASFHRLVGLAHKYLGGRPRAAQGAEDVALAAFDSFVRRAAAGRFPRLDDRNDLWQVLFLLTARKAAKLVRADEAAKRHPDRGVPAGSPADPADAVALADSLAHMLAVLEKPDLQQVAVWKLEGFTNAEIGARLGRAVSTVERKLGVIRAVFERNGFYPGPGDPAAGARDRSAV